METKVWFSCWNCIYSSRTWLLNLDYQIILVQSISKARQIYPLLCSFWIQLPCNWTSNKVAQHISTHIPEIVWFTSLTAAEKQKFSDYRNYLRASIEYWLLVQQSTSAYIEKPDFQRHRNGSASPSQTTRFLSLWISFLSSLIGSKHMLEGKQRLSNWINIILSKYLNLLLNFILRRVNKKIPN